MKVTGPVGLAPPDKVAVSFKVVPIAPPADGVVEIVGLALPTETVSHEPAVLFHFVVSELV